MLYNFLLEVVPQSLVDNDCLDIDSVQHVHDVAGADALATFLIPVFQKLHVKILVYEIPAHRFYLCVDSDESSFGCL
jgi:hypothetical protein